MAHASDPRWHMAPCHLSSISTTFYQQQTIAYSVTAGGSRCLVLGTFKHPENATKQSNQYTLATISKCNMHIFCIIAQQKRRSHSDSPNSLESWRPTNLTCKVAHLTPPSLPTVLRGVWCKPNVFFGGRGGVGGGVDLLRCSFQPIQGWTSLMLLWALILWPQRRSMKINRWRSLTGQVHKPSLMETQQIDHSSPCINVESLFKKKKKDRWGGICDQH